MKVLVTGVQGQLGHDVVKELTARHITVVGIDKDDCDITDMQAVENVFSQIQPDVVVHCAAYTAVDKAEDDAVTCYSVNVIGTENIAQVCKMLQAKMVYISTDYVFSGRGETPFEVTDTPDPQTVYGETKLAGENAITKFLDRFFIIRTAWVFGANGHNFVKTMLRLGKERSEVGVVSDQFGSPTYTVDLAYLICDMIMTEKYGMYHATNEGFCHWAEFAEEIFRQARLSTKVKHLTSDEYPAKARRPYNSRLSKESLDKNGFSRLPHWKDALQRYLQELHE